MNVYEVTFGGYLAKILSFKIGNLLNSKFHLLSEGTVECSLRDRKLGNNQEIYSFAYIANTWLVLQCHCFDLHDQLPRNCVHFTVPHILSCAGCVCFQRSVHCFLKDPAMALSCLVNATALLDYMSRGFFSESHTVFPYIAHFLLVISHLKGLL